MTPSSPSAKDMGPGKERPDWVVCIRKPKESDKHRTWCGRGIGGEFYLTGLDHAACLDGSRLVPCPSCVDIATLLLKDLSQPAVGF